MYRSSAGLFVAGLVALAATGACVQDAAPTSSDHITGGAANAPRLAPTVPAATAPAFAQPPLADEALTIIAPSSRYLPKWKTHRELALEARGRQLGGAGAIQGRSLLAADVFSDYRAKNFKKFFITQAPQIAVRMPAEYEPSQAWMVHWPMYTQPAWRKFFGEMVQAAWGTVPALMVYNDATHKSWIEQELQALGIPAAELQDPTKIIWWEHATNAHWVRDYGPLSLQSLSSTQQLSFVDFRYYHARQYDDEIPTDLAAEWGVNVYRPDLDFEGGNFMTTSEGLCSSTKGVLYYNPQLSQSAVEQLYGEYLACKSVVWAEPMTGGVIAHIDMFSKFASDTTMLVGEYTAAQSADNKAILDANAELFSGLTTPGGNTISVIRIPMPDNTGGLFGTKIWRTYTNSLALSSASGKVVMIPVYAADRSQEAAALAAYGQAFPGWTLVPVDSDVIIPGQGAIHCVTMQIPAGARAKMESDPLDLCGSQLYRCVSPLCGALTASGCCDGEVLRYCADGLVKAEDCAARPSCGWSAASGTYDCNTAGDVDPGGTLPRSCAVAMDAAVVTDAGADATPAGCGAMTEEGCCDGATVWYCLNGELKHFSCFNVPQCGWEAQNAYYNCGTTGAADPAGVHPQSCASFFGDAGPPSPDAGIPQPCGDVTSVGCCDGDVLQICRFGKLKLLDCAARTEQCGWGEQTYVCGNDTAAEPSGRHLRACVAEPLDAGAELGSDGVTPDAAPAPDLAVLDLGRDGATDAAGEGAQAGDGGPDGGCSCAVGGGTGTSGGAASALVLVVLLAQRSLRRWRARRAGRRPVKWTPEGA